MRSPSQASLAALTGCTCMGQSWRGDRGRHNQLVKLLGAMTDARPREAGRLIAFRVAASDAHVGDTPTVANQDARR